CRHQHVEPAKHERSSVAERLMQKDIDAAGARQERAQFRRRECAADADQAEGRPESHDDERIRDEARDGGWLAENAAADCDADDEGGSAPETDDAPETA